MEEEEEERQEECGESEEDNYWVRIRSRFGPPLFRTWFE